MKKILFILLALMMTKGASAQLNDSIHTPTGEWIHAYRIVWEATSDELMDMEYEAGQWIIRHNSSAVRVDPASELYNCHAYAWHMSDGGRKYWVTRLAYNLYRNIEEYWSGTRPTYSPTTLGYATKAYYPKDDHSVKVISPYLFESKWGAWPRYQHAMTDCPYDTTGIQYFCIPVYGPTTLCTSNLYYTLSIQGATYNWTGNRIGITGSGYYVTGTMQYEGEGWIKGTIYSPKSMTTVTTQQKRLVLKVNGSFTGPASVNYLQTGTWTGTASCGVAPYTYQWYIRKSPATTSSLVGTGNPITLQAVLASSSTAVSSTGVQVASDPVVNNARRVPVTSSAFYLYMKVMDANGNSTVTPEMKITSPGNVKLVQSYSPELMAMNVSPQSSDKFFNIYPNPVSNDLNVSINTESSRNMDQVFQVNILDKNMKLMKQLTTKNRQFSISVIDMNPDIYFIQVLNQGKQWVEQFVVK